MVHKFHVGMKELKGNKGEMAWSINSTCGYERVKGEQRGEMAWSINSICGYERVKGEQGGKWHGP